MDADPAGSRARWLLWLCLACACAGTIPDPEAEEEQALPTDPLTPGGIGPAPGQPTRADVDPGRVTLRRLTRAEYNNTVRDLLESKLRPADAFPAEPVGLGFDNNGDVQTLTTSQIEQYESAASALIEEAWARGGVGALAAAARRKSCALADATCAPDLVGGFAERAWRRPVRKEELDRVLAIGTGVTGAGGDATAAFKATLIGVLLSPHFLFRPEVSGAGAVRTLGDHELAARLSYLIYGSMPDDALFAAAAAGRLRKPEEVETQVKRMLADAKAAGFVEAFAGQWLDVRELDSHEVDAKLFPELDPPLREAMKQETFRFFADFIAAGRPVEELLTARFSFLDARLRRHYGMAGGAPSHDRVELAGRERGGLLTHAAVLTATSAPNETNPVARGNWVLTKLLCAPPPPPPPNVPPPPEMPPAGTTARARFEAHRVDPTCASCHRLMDPIGFGLENYDAIGRYRTMDNGGRIDASGELPGGVKFDGAAELAVLLAKDPKFSSCLARNLFIYAFGRDPGDGQNTPDGRLLEGVLARGRNRAGALTLENLIAAVATSDAFRLRSNETGAQP